MFNNRKPHFLQNLLSLIGIKRIHQRIATAHISVPIILFNPDRIDRVVKAKLNGTHLQYAKARKLRYVQLQINFSKWFAAGI